MLVLVLCLSVKTSQSPCKYRVRFDTVIDTYTQAAGQT